MTTSPELAVQEVQLARSGTFVDLTEVLWIDIVLNISWLLVVVGLMCWIGWGFLERRHGVRGAVRRHDEKQGSMPGRRPRVRVVLAGLSVVGCLVELGFGIGLNGRPGELGENAGLMLWTGIIGLASWLVVAVFLRPRPWPERAGDDPRKKSSEESAEHVDPGGARSTHG